MIFVARSVRLHGSALFDVRDGGIADFEIDVPGTDPASLDLFCGAYGDVTDLGNHLARVVGAGEDGEPLINHKAKFSWPSGPYPREVWRVPLAIPRHDARYVFTLHVDEAMSASCDLRVRVE